jgi:small GTP-binding protein
MQTKKICLWGASGVGKTSLVGRFVRQKFSDKYLTTIGVKVDKKKLSVGDTPIKLMIWDLTGEDEFEQLQLKYTRGAQGCLIVVDGTRHHTFETALSVNDRMTKLNGPVPAIFLFNKNDLIEDWVIMESDTDALTAKGTGWLNTSAKDDMNVDLAFNRLAEKMLA